MPKLLEQDIIRFPDATGETVCSAEERQQQVTSEEGARIASAMESIADSFERISRNVEGLYALAEVGLKRALPGPRGQRPAVATRIQTPEEKVAQDQQRAESQSTDDWLREFGGDEEFIGEREREFLRQQAEQRQPDSAGQGEESAGSAAPAGSETGGVSPVSGNQPNPQESPRRPARVTKRDAARG